MWRGEQVHMWLGNSEGGVDTLMLPTSHTPLQELYIDYHIDYHPLIMGSGARNTTPLHSGGDRGMER